MPEIKRKQKSVIFYAISILCLALSIVMLLIPFTVYLKETVYAVPLTGGSRTELTSNRDSYTKTFFDYISYLEFKGWEPTVEILFIASLFAAFAVAVFLTVITLIQLKKNTKASKVLKFVLLGLSVISLLSCIMSIYLQADASTWKLCDSETYYISNARLIDQTTVCGAVMLIPTIVLTLAAFALQVITGVLNLKSSTEVLPTVQQNTVVFENNTETADSSQTTAETNTAETVNTKNDNYSKTEADNLRAVNEGIGLIFQINGVRGRSIKVYRDRCVIKVKAGLGSLITGNITDGEKTIYYSDCIGVQFKEAGVLIGYLQLETASATMNQKSDNFFNENTFTFDLSTTTNEIMRDVHDYVQGQIRDIKNGNRNVQNTVVASAADELKKYKELLDMGVITQEEFDAKKKQLLNL